MQRGARDCFPSPPAHSSCCLPFCWSLGSRRQSCKKILSTSAGHAGKPEVQSASSAKDIPLHQLHQDVKHLLVTQVMHEASAVPLYTRQWASTRRCVQTSSRIGHTGSGRWCWGSRRWGTSVVSQICTPTPAKRQNQKNIWQDYIVINISNLIFGLILATYALNLIVLIGNIQVYIAILVVHFLMNYACHN